MKKKLILLATALALGVSACAFRPEKPPVTTTSESFVVERDLVGSFTARGNFKPIIGKERGLTAKLEGTWDGTTLILVEDFFYDDGEIDKKTWRLKKLANGEWSGTREDVLGEARGYFDGTAFRLEYKVKLGGQTYEFKDVLVNRSSNEVYNKAVVGFYGLKVGGVELLIKRN